MAIDHIADQPGSIDATEPANYPYGKAQNESALGSGDGTAWIETLINDLLGWQQALLVAAGIIPSGAPENAVASDYLDAIAALRTAALAASPALGGPVITGGTATSTTLVTAIINLANITSAGDLQIADGGTAASTALGAFNNIKQQATEALVGAAAVASGPTTDLGVNDTQIVTPLKLHATPIHEPFTGSVIGKQLTVIDCFTAGTGITIAADAPSGQIELSAASGTVSFDITGTTSTIVLANVFGDSAPIPIGMYMIKTGSVTANAFIDPNYEAPSATADTVIESLDRGTWTTSVSADDLSRGAVMVISNGVSIRARTSAGGNLTDRTLNLVRIAS